MDSDDDSLGEDHKSNPGIQNFETVKAPNRNRESRSFQVQAAEASNFQAVDVNRQPSASSRAYILEPRQAVVHPQPQILKVVLFGYSFWLYPVGPFQFLDFGRQYISLEDQHAQPGPGPRTSRMLGAGCSSTSNPVASGSQNPSANKNQTTEMKHEEENSDDSEEMQQAFTTMSPSEPNVSNKSDVNAGAAAGPAEVYKDVEKSNDDEAVGVASGYDSSCAGPSGTQPVDGPLPSFRRKKVEQMNRDEMNEHFRYLCEDNDNMATPRVRPEERSREIRRQLEEAEQEQIVHTGQMREVNVGLRPFMEYCNALLRDEPPSPEYSEDSDDEHEWRGPPISRRSRRIPPGPDIRAIFNRSNRFHDIDVFPHENLIFISISRHGDRDTETVRVNNVNHVFPDYCVETTSRRGAIAASITLTASIDNFCNLRVVHGLPLDTFDRDFNNFLASMYHGGTIYQIGMCRVRLGWHLR